MTSLVVVVACQRRSVTHIFSVGFAGNAALGNERFEDDDDNKETKNER